jgi:thymidylate synthase (FAD)
MKTKLTARLIALTQPTIELREYSAEGLVAFCARVSNPDYQDKAIGSLFDYCMKNKHWSIFEMADAVVEIEAPRDITRQLLRHSSFSFQEFSQRYSDQIQFTEREYRKQDTKNRQNSTDDLPTKEKLETIYLQDNLVVTAEQYYIWAREKSVAKECARVFLPEGLTMSRLYMKGSLRSWLHYLDVREGNGTQLEHIVLANRIRECLTPAFPNVLGVKVD